MRSHSPQTSQAGRTAPARHTRRTLSRAAVAAATSAGVTGLAPISGQGITRAEVLPDPQDAPGEQRVSRSRRPAREVATDLRTRLAAYEESAKRSGPGQGNGRRLLTELAQASKDALTDLESQVHGGTSPIYWAASIIRDAVAAKDTPSLARAARYLDAALRPAT